MIPKAVTAVGDTYPSCSQDERCHDIFKALQEFDVVALQETYGGFYSEIREKIISYATKAGFLHIVHDDEPSFGSSYLTDGGLMILSRFPILTKSYLPFSWS
jgi:hypothetical protein